LPFLAVSHTSDALSGENNSKRDRSEEQPEEDDAAVLFAHHLLHEKEYYELPMTKINTSKKHLKDNLIPPMKPPAWEFDMAIDPPREQASMETFAHHLLHDEEYERKPITKHHIKDNYIPPVTPPATPEESERNHMKVKNYVPPCEVTPPSPDDMEKGPFDSLSYAGHFVDLFEPPLSPPSRGHRHSF
jgi:hypothetical protein